MSGVENYSRHFDGRAAGEAPYTLLDYLGEEFVVFLDESHVLIPQLTAQQAGDRSRKLTLVEHGFRLPSAVDNRPLSSDEFWGRAATCVMVSATPGPYERSTCTQTVEMLVRPTGIVDPVVEVAPGTGAVADFVARAERCAVDGQRVLATVLTKKMAEDLVSYLVERGVRARWMHSDTETLERIELLRELRLGSYDVLVGINLLREGLDLPEVALVAVFDADREGFLRSATSLVRRSVGRRGISTAVWCCTPTGSPRQCGPRSTKRIGDVGSRPSTTSIVALSRRGSRSGCMRFLWRRASRAASSRRRQWSICRKISTVRSSSQSRICNSQLSNSSSSRQRTGATLYGSCEQSGWIDGTTLQYGSTPETGPEEHDTSQHGRILSEGGGKEGLQYYEEKGGCET